MEPPTLKQLVAFVILMESGEGIKSKTPSYVMEKFNLCVNCPEHFLYQLFDEGNMAKFLEYLKFWKEERER